MTPPDFSGVRGIYFDLDDTLCAYWDASRAGLLAAFREHGPKGVAAEDMVGHWSDAFKSFYKDFKNSPWYSTYLKSGETTRAEQMRLALLEVGVDDREAAGRLGAAYHAARQEALELFPEAEMVLIALKQKYPLGLITNGPADVQRHEIEVLEIGHYFDHIFIEGEMGQGKPEFQVFDRAENAMGLKPSELLFVGNSYGHDVEPAIKKGWRSVWVRRPSDIAPSRGNGASPEQKPEGGPSPDAEITDLRELLPWL